MPERQLEILPLLFVAMWHEKDYILVKPSSVNNGFDKIEWFCDLNQNLFAIHIFGVREKSLLNFFIKKLSKIDCPLVMRL